jgi:hypothetical protein
MAQAFNQQTYLKTPEGYENSRLCPLPVFGNFRPFKTGKIPIGILNGRVKAAGRKKARRTEEKCILSSYCPALAVRR